MHIALVVLPSREDPVALFRGHGILQHYGVSYRGCAVLLGPTAVSLDAFVADIDIHGVPYSVKFNCVVSIIFALFKFYYRIALIILDTVLRRDPPGIVPLDSALGVPSIQTVAFFLRVSDK